MKKYIQFFIGCLLLCISYTLLYANGEIVEREYSTSLSEATGIIRIIVAVFGGIIGILGIIVAIKGVAGKSDVSISFSEQRKIVFKRITQGVLITIIGAGILIASIYLLPEKRKETTASGKSASKEEDGNKIKWEAKK